MAGYTYSVSEINTYINRMFLQDFVLGSLMVKGEVSNCKYYPSGHIYFSIKDGGGVLKCVMFAGSRAGLGFKLEDGQNVVVAGQIKVYEANGTYQLYAKKITLDGEGDLYLRFEKLKKELSEMGMFDEMYKKKVPKYASRIGVVTASTGAVIHDILNVSARRNPYVQIVLYPCAVQGAEAVPTIVKGIETLDEMGFDIIIVGRGGGSIEDLWAFNEEAVARAIFNARTPIISAVGHETDTTIADYVADLRAPTPSAAAELAVFDYKEFEDTLSLYKDKLYQKVSIKVNQKKQELKLLESSINLKSPKNRLHSQKQKLDELADRLGFTFERKLTKDKNRLAVISEKLHGLSPLKKISGGFSYITANDKAVVSVNDIKAGDILSGRLKDGSFTAVVEGTNNQEI